MLKLLRSVFSPKFTNETNFEDETKLLLAYRMSLFLTIAIGILTIVLFIYFSIVIACVTLSAFISVLVTTAYIYRTSKFRIPTILFNIIGAVCCTSTLFFIHNQPHFLDGFWMTINILFAFIVLGARWGIGFTLFHAACQSVYFYYFLDDQMQIMRDLTHEQLVAIVINCLLCFSIIGYLGWENIRTNEVGKKKLNEAQDVLQVQYNIISKQNEEKTVMLKEIHHRVKNNLQIITSLLRLQSRELENPEAIAKFKDATHRVIAMSMIHEKMYQSDHLSTLHLREYLHDLSTDLVSSYQSGYPVNLKIDCDIDSIGLRSVVPIALILNELISNSLKYAFDDYDNCLITISFMHYQGKKCKLLYKDSGTWKAPSRQGSFGLDLIESLTEQLEGTMDLKTYPETSFEIIFSPQEDK
ncbi:sensor histidine kinase [Fluviicola taffensis]|uniref:histidine kinase n=1 Tax=Fluviicola taffensis (strain DSM 16823 / NCIMB 13979 / RW262) TaxID=755732 RepID=F2IBT7_FLUTR|nr:sensor histidine kinase [Fluviicola taffensis]AEA42165.1 signal transduction histidine kinase [Fluviicola taffensis DSM 16823]